MNIDDQTVIQIFYKMLRSRLFEEKVVSLKEQKLIADSLKLSFGAEATAGAVFALNDDDIIFASGRFNTVAVSGDVDCELLFSELLGDANGLCGGVSGMDSIADNTVNFYGTSALSGAQFAKACGAAMSLKIQNRDNVAVCFAGDGDCAEGSFYEALNLACLNKLPIVFYIENNCYAGNTPSAKINHLNDIAERAKAFDIPGLIVDGNNAVETYTAMLTAKEFAKQSGPVLLEAKTYRLSAYSYEDDNSYVSEDEISQWVGYDAIENMKEYMLGSNICLIDDLVTLRAAVKDDIEASCEEALRKLELSKHKEPVKPSVALNVADIIKDLDEE